VGYELGYETRMGEPHGSEYHQAYRHPDGRRFSRVVFTPNGRIKPDWVEVDERPEKHPEGAYYLDWTEDGLRLGWLRRELSPLDWRFIDWFVPLPLPDPLAWLAPECPLRPVGWGEARQRHTVAGQALPGLRREPAAIRRGPALPATP
jgi:hypothetical protein